MPSPRRVSTHHRVRLTPHRAVFALVLVAALVRVHAFARDVRFHPDEALFSTFARSAALNGTWLFPGALDKPPLALYASALSMSAFVIPDNDSVLGILSPRAGELAARLPNLCAGLLLVALGWRLAARLFGRRAALAALALLAVSPYGVAFSATAFTDTLMLTLTTWALLLATAHRPGWAGAALALAFWAKFQAAFSLPLLVLFVWIATPTRAAFLVALARTLSAFALGVLLLTAWDAARLPVSSSLFALNTLNNDPARLIRSGEVVPRLTTWAAHAVWLFGTPVHTALVGLAAALGSVVGAARLLSPRRQAYRAALALFALAYAALHWLIAFNTYDRYLLPLLVPLALLCASTLAHRHNQTAPHAHPRPVVCPANRLRSAQRGAAAALFVLTAGVWLCSHAPPVGGDDGSHAGIDTVAAWLDSRALGAIVYDHWLGWELDYYLGAWTDKRRVYYPTPRALAHDALRQPDPAPRYFIAPRAQPHTRWLDALAAAGFAPRPAYATPRFIVYSLTPPVVASHPRHIHRQIVPVAGKAEARIKLL